MKKTEIIIYIISLISGIALILLGTKGLTDIAKMQDLYINLGTTLLGSIAIIRVLQFLYNRKNRSLNEFLSFWGESAKGHRFILVFANRKL